MFAKKLKELRSGRMSQAELARLLGVTQQAVGKWEKGIATPDYATLAKIATLFDVSTDYLITGKFLLKNPSAPDYDVYIENKRKSLLNLISSQDEDTLSGAIQEAMNLQALDTK
jgi:transcriptional regulator with XRE-family HTH domain